MQTAVHRTQRASPGTSGGRPARGPRRVNGSQRPQRPQILTRATPDLKEDKKSAPATAPSPGKIEKAPLEPPPSPKGFRPRKLSTAEIIADKALNMGSDIYRHLKRQVAAKPTQTARDQMQAGGEGRIQLKRHTSKPVVMVLGSGWAAHSCIKVIDTDTYDVVVVSPRNFFLFTPMLPSTAVGTVEFRSLLEPIRTSNEFVSYLEASCDSINVKEKVAVCTATKSYENGYTPSFEVHYDLLVVAVGEMPATFGVPGVQQHCCFMKEVSDTRNIRNRIGGCFELAALPGATDEDRYRLLHFVVVGGGPTGVEFAGTLADYVRTDLSRKYPDLMDYVRVSLVQSSQTILNQFDSRLAARAMDNLKRTGITLRTGARVTQVTQNQVVLSDGERMDYGLCVWSTGNATRPLVQDLVKQVPEQVALQRSPNPVSHKLAVDGYMRMIGAQDVIALGDCSAVQGDNLPATAQVAGQQGAYIAHVINRGFTFGLGGVDEPPPRKAVHGLLDNININMQLPQLPGSKAPAPPAPVPAPSTAEGLNRYQANALAAAAPEAKIEYCKRPFEFVSLGIMAYVGDDKALTQIEAGDGSVNLYGGFAYLLWRSVYITKQVSFRNRVLILFDWLKAQVFGRDISMF